MFTTEITRSGELTLLIEGKAVHSKYDPIAEANTFLEKQTFKKNPQIFILIGPGLGYLKSSIIKQFPDVQILSFHLDKKIFEYANKTGHNWVYGEKTDPVGKLSHCIPDFLLFETAILKWLPCTEKFPDRTKYIENRIHQFFLERKGTIFTTENFGRKWIRNIFHNYKNTRHLVNIDQLELPVLIAASGPSLRKSLDIIKGYRDNFILAALPSSIAALGDAGIRPDLIFHTDPGFWANEHLKHLIDTEIPIIMPLTSSFMSNMKNPVILINQGSFLESMLLGKSFLHVPAHGTVAGTAYLFLRKITDKPIVFLGLDFCFDDVMEHVKPHSFDILNEIKQNRLFSYLHILYQKQQRYLGLENKTKTTKAFSIYSGWFNDKSRLSDAYRFSATEIVTQGLQSIDTDKLIALLGKFSVIEKPQKLTKPSTAIFSNEKFAKALNYINLSLKNFRTEIPSMNSGHILNFFTASNLITEIFQYTAYSDILKLTHNYKSDMDESKIILEGIHTKARVCIEELSAKVLYEQE